MTTNDAEHRTYEANDVLYPQVTVELIGQDGNAFYILGAVRKALTQQVSKEAAAEFYTEATTGDYNHLLATAMKYVDVI